MLRTRSLVFSALAILLSPLGSLGVPAPSRAQTRPATAGIEGPARLWTAPQGALSVGTHPAAMAWTDGVRVRLLYVGNLGGANLDVGRGTGLYAVGGLPYGIGLGFSAERVEGATLAGDDADFGRLAIGLAWAPGRTFAIGGTLHYVAGGSFGGVTGLNLSVGMRPSRFLEFSLVAHDVLGPLGLTTSTRDVPATFHLAAALIAGDTGVRVEAGVARSTDNRLGLRGAVLARVPRFGDLVAQVEVDDLRETRGRQREVRVTGGVEARLGNHSVGGGATGRFNPDGAEGTSGFVTGEFGGPWARGLPEPRYVAELEIRDMSARGLVRVVHLLDRALHEREVAGVVLRPRVKLPLAHAQELRLMVDALMAAGKPVVCHLESASAGEWYACAGAARTWIDPAGSVQLIGPSMEMMSLGTLLENAGVRADFVRIGDYKSAPEQFTHERMSAPAREQYDAFLDDVYTRFTADLARDAEVSVAHVRGWVDSGPYVAPEAVTGQLVDGALGAEDLRESAREVLGTRSIRQGLRTYRDEDGPRLGIGIVVVDGAIVDGENVDIPLINIHQSGARTIIATLDAYARDPNIAAIVLRIDSPGGSALASEQIWRAIRRAREHKPVIASLGAVAASGGYYIASAADEIWADPATLTGSIGIYYGKVDFQQLAERVGVNVEIMGRGRRSGATSLFRPFTDDERARLQEMIAAMYQLFLTRVAEGRDMTVEEVDALGQGRIFSGDRALRNGLVDHLGGLGSALAWARQRGNLAPGCRVSVAPGRPDELLDYVLGDVAGSAELGRGGRVDGPTQPAMASSALEWMVMMSQIGELGALAHLPELGAVE